MKWMTRSLVLRRMVLPARWDVYGGIARSGRNHHHPRAPSPMDAGRLARGDPSPSNSNEPPWSRTTMAHTPLELRQGTAWTLRFGFVGYTSQECTVPASATGIQRLDVRLTAGVALNASEVVADGERTKPVQRINPKSRRAFPLPEVPLKTCSFKPRSISRASCPAGTTCVEEVLTRTSSTSMTSRVYRPFLVRSGQQRRPLLPQPGHGGID